MQRNSLKAGTRIRFVVALEKPSTRIEAGDTGRIISERGPFGFYSVLAKRQRWLCRDSEIEPVDKAHVIE